MPLFALYHMHMNHEDTQSGLPAMDAGLFRHLLQAIERMDTYILALADHGLRYGSIRQSEAGIFEESNPFFWAIVFFFRKRSFEKWIFEK